MCLKLPPLWLLSPVQRNREQVEILSPNGVVALPLAQKDYASNVNQSSYDMKELPQSEMIAMEYLLTCIMICRGYVKGKCAG